jgi:hypothetical protein
VPRTQRKQGAPPPPTAGGMTLGTGAPAAAPGAAPGAGGGRGDGRGRGGAGSNLPPLERSVYINPKGGVEEDYPLDVHTRNFLDCVKSRQKPASDMEIGYYAALPCLLALEALKEGRALGWDAGSRRSKTL